MGTNEIVNGLKVYYWDDIGYMARFAVTLKGGVDFDVYIIEGTRPLTEMSLNKYADKKERLYSRKGSLNKEDFVTMKNIQDAKVFLKGCVNADGSLKYDFTEQDLDVQYKSEQDVNDLSHLITRLYKIAKGLTF